MKKTISALTALLMLVCLCSPAFASFTPSVSQKGAPELISVSQGSISDVIITAYKDIDKADSAVDTDALLDAYSEVRNAGGPSDLVASAVSGKYACRDFFDILLKGEAKAAFDNGTALTLTFRVTGYTVTPVVLTKCENAWKEIAAVNLSGNTLSITFASGDLCPVAIFDMAQQSPSTGVVNTTIIAVAAGVCLAAAVAFFFIAKKSKSHAE